MEGIRRNDRFVSYCKGSISASDYQVLSLLYQPIIGNGAYTLYTVLTNLLDRQSLVSQEYVHADLESLLNEKLELIEKNRYRLEAIGLLETFYFDDHFAYELKMPLSAQSFVNDGVLGQYLIAAVTKERFLKLIQIFKLRSPSIRKHIRMTKSFDEVFPAIHLTDSDNEADLRSDHPNGSLKINNTNFDWRLFLESLPSEFVDCSSITDALKNKISNLNYVYGLNEIEMKDAVLKATDSDKQVSLTKLAVNARETFKLNRQSSPVSVPKSEPLQKNLPNDPVEYFKTVTPEALLAEMGGGKVSTADLRIVERLLEEVGIDKGVLNVLLAYVARIKEGSLPTYAYFEKVSLDWLRNQVTSVEVAVDYVKHLISERTKSKESGQRKTYKKSSQNKPEVKIDWLDDYIKSLE
ncbi:MAG: DnaD domain protein [Bacilli bacterium]|nr:DnaD domain protein [Bacilli bacterium]MBN2696114.1 DnaD domain protein [Bacilli bacterium]